MGVRMGAGLLTTNLLQFNIIKIIKYGIRNFQGQSLKPWDYNLEIHLTKNL